MISHSLPFLSSPVSILVYLCVPICSCMHSQMLKWHSTYQIHIIKCHLIILFFIVHCLFTMHLILNRTQIYLGRWKILLDGGLVEGMLHSVGFHTRDVTDKRRWEYVYLQTIRCSSRYKLGMNVGIRMRDNVTMTGRNAILI